MVSVIIPTFNEEKALPPTLETLFRQNGHYEVIVADGGSSDNTRAIARTDHRIKLVTAAKGRAIQMNAGARLAHGEWLLFLHADTSLPIDALDRLNSLEGKNDCQAGGFRHSFSGNNVRLRAISWLNNTRARLTRVIYGDQALFVRRRLFNHLGGFPEQPELEDLLFCEKLNRVTRPVLLDLTIVTDSRKFIQMGVWKSLIRCLMILICHCLHIPVIPKKFFTDIR